ncbi:hypothetical protein C6502_22455 [Candidatus Poribacteria bacterium]|nr:MAG: hypothetical protein C6502_22455 [Candidatus Poribacteria bacterium]
MIQKFFNVGVLVGLVTLAGYVVIGCSESALTEKIDEPVTINLLATSPETGGTVSATADLRIVFDSAPKSVIVDGIPAIILNNTALVPIGDLPDVIPGTEKSVIIEWRNPDNSVAGAKTITFTVLDPPIDRFTFPNFVVVEPSPGAMLPSNQSFNLTFDQGVRAVTVNGVAATGSGLNWTVSLTLQEGDGQVLNVIWTNRDHSTGSRAVGPYVIRDPDVTLPVIVAGTVRDGDANIDPARINASGFRFDFNEPVTGSIKLTDEAGADLNWIATVAARTATLTPVVGQELANETVYKIEIDVRDGSGNPAQWTITFVTIPKE